MKMWQEDEKEPLLHVQASKTQISLYISMVLSGPSLATYTFLYVDTVCWQTKMSRSDCKNVQADLGCYVLHMAHRFFSHI